MIGKTNNNSESNKFKDEMDAIIYFGKGLSDLSFYKTGIILDRVDDYSICLYSCFENFSKSLELDPNRIETRIGLGNAKYVSGDANGQKKECESIKNLLNGLEVSLVLGHVNRADLWFMVGEYDNGLSDLESAEKLANSPDDYYDIAKGRIDIGDYSNAKVNIEKSLSLKPKNLVFKSLNHKIDQFMDKYK